MDKMMASRRLLLLQLAAMTQAPAAWAQSAWPRRPVRLIVPYPPGGPTDILARVVGQQISQELGQPVLIDNRPGASGVLGSAEVARANPDGDTFLVNASIHTIIPHMQPRMPFDTLNAFAPVTQIAAVPLICVVSPELPVRTVPELIAYLRAHPGSVSYGSAGNGTAMHLAGEMFKAMTGTDMVHVPYRGSSPAIQDLMAGRIQVMFDSVPSSAGTVRQGLIRGLAVTTATRLAAFPELPTVAEAGVPGFEIATWYGIWAPAGTAEGIVQRMQTAVSKAVVLPEVTERMRALGAEPVASSPGDFGVFVSSEYERWGALVRAAQITID
jgi:tripartite-type tricarboxylate transporter receptor subunit TctC